MIIADFFPKNLFKSRVVFITGGGSGINLGIGKHFAALGAHVGICGRTQEKLDAAAKEIEGLGAEVFKHACDVRNYPAVQEAVNGCRDALGPIDVLVCGAAGNFPAPAIGLSPNGFKAVVDIDLLGSFNACRAAVEQLQETRGNIIFITAGQAMAASALQCHVGAAKAGIENLMRNLALEWGPMGIRSNSVVPGPIEGTEGMRRLAPPGAAELINEVVPLQRHGTIDDVAQACVFLASPLASYVTGTTLMVDGGSTLPGFGLMGKMLMEAMAGE